MDSYSTAIRYTQSNYINIVDTVYTVYTHGKFTCFDVLYIGMEESLVNTPENSAEFAPESPKEAEIDVNKPLSTVIIEQPTVNGEQTTAPKRRRKRAESAQVISEPEKMKEKPSHVVLKCECGADIMPDKNGMYPARCPSCGTWNDYRGIAFLEQSENILVCDKCGGLTLIEPDTECCKHCGAR